MGGFQSVAAENAANGSLVRMPNANTSSMAVTVPDDAMPVKLPPVTAGTFSSMPMFEDQNFTQQELVITPTTPLQTLSPTWEVFTTGNQILSLDNAYVTVRGFINLIPGYANTFQAYPMTGTDGTAFIFPAGGLWSLVQNLTVQINGTPLPNYQSGNVIPQMYAHGVDVPMTYSGDVAYAYNTQMNSAQGDLGVVQLFNRQKQGAIRPYSDFAGITNTPATSAVGQVVYFNVPLKSLWTFYQQPGRFFTNDAKLRFNFVLSGLELVGTQVAIYHPSYTGLLNSNTTTFTKVTTPNTQCCSQPVSITLTDMLFVFPMFNTKSQFQDMNTALVAERPLTMTMNNIEVYPDPAGANIDLSLSANWGKGPIRQLIKGSGYLPHHCIAVPIVTVTWASQTISGETFNPFNIGGGFTWSRSIIMPGLIYYRRIYLGGQPYYDDMVVSQFGVSTVVGAINGYTQSVEKRTRKIQQQGNYLNAPDQMWLNGYENFTQLAPTNALSIDTLTVYSSILSPQDLNLGRQLCGWATGVGMNGMSLSQDPSLDTLVDSRQQSFEVEWFSMPYWGRLQSVPDGIAALAFFSGVDVVWTYNATITNQTFGMMPSSAVMNLNHALPYAMTVDYGRGRTTQYQYLQPEMASTTNVPM